ncbi:DUF2007 domain-containing protein [Flavobacteriales bacterium]|nr:DUF2007 domain-containing protein [Flavobacteriales bacterium]
MSNEWIEIYSTNDIFEAEVIKNMLLSNDIKAIIMNQQDSSYHFGTAKIYTEKKNISKAKEIISE